MRLWILIALLGLGLLALVLLVLLGLLIWWLSRHPRGEPAPLAQEEAIFPVVEPPSSDDLKLVEGIGPKISALLGEAGITTYAQLAASDVSRLEGVLREAGITIADPTTWPEQASLAAAGDWDTLEALQDELEGGRRV